jgi:predicted RNase H-like HicB family nuclease
MRRDVIHGVIHLDQDTFVAECLEIAIVTQGDTLHAVIKNLNDALALHLDGEDLAAFGLSSHPQPQLSFEPPLSL